MGKSGRLSTGDVDVKLRELDAKMAELREVTRAANETLGDLRRERRETQKWIDMTFEGRMLDQFRRLQKEIDEFHDDFSREIVRHCDHVQRAIANRWKYIEMMCVAAPEMARMIAVHVIQQDGEPVKMKDGQWHLVKEEVQATGRVFAFHSSLRQRADFDTAVDKALQQAVEDYIPDFELFTSYLDSEGLDKK